MNDADFNEISAPGEAVGLMNTGGAQSFPSNPGYARPLLFGLVPTA
jgi:hypothetical protein